MGPLLAWMIRNPTRAALICGLLVAVVFGWLSFPSDKTLEKTVRDWLPQGQATGATASALRQVIEDATDGDLGRVVKVSEREFRELNLPIATALTSPADDERAFTIQYAGKESEAAQTVYLAERTVANAPWWSPERWVYRAIEAQVDEVSSVLRLTFERDLTGLLALLLMDLIVGGAYGVVVGMILAVLGSETLDKRQAPKPLPAPSPPLPINPRGIFRA